MEEDAPSFDFGRTLFDGRRLDCDGELQELTKDEEKNLRDHQIATINRQHEAEDRLRNGGAGYEDPFSFAGMMQIAGTLKGQASEAASSL